MPNIVGYVGQESHDKLVQRIEDQEQFYADQLKSYWQSCTLHWRQYLGDRPDNRLPHEKWRARTHVPWPYVTVETGAAAVAETMAAADPPIQGDGVGPEDDDNARRVTAWSRYVLEKNR